MTTVTAPSSRGRFVFLTLTIVFAAATIRAPIVAIAPVAGIMTTALHIGAGVLGLLTTIPVLIFAAGSPVAVRVARRVGVEFALTICLIGTAVACVVRSAGGFGFAIVGTVLLGLVITIGNVIIPVIIAHEYPPERVSQMTAVFTAAINLGTMTVTIATAPLEPGLGWQGAIAIWGGLGIIALVFWAATHGAREVLLPGPGEEAIPVADRAASILRAPSTWLLALAFATQSFAFFAVSAWLPTLLADNGFPLTGSGLISGIFQALGIAGALLVPLVSRRTPSLVGVVIGASLCWFVVTIGFIVAPGLWALWCTFGGIGQGSSLTLVFVMIVRLGGGTRVIASRSGAVQGIGYVIGAAGPATIGALHDLTGAWEVPLVVVTLVIVVFAVTGVLAARILHRADTDAAEAVAR